MFFSFRVNQLLQWPCSIANVTHYQIPWIPQGSAAESAAAVAIRGSAAFRHVAFAAAAARRHEAWHVAWHAGRHGECWA